VDVSQNIFFKLQEGEKIVKAIQSVRPISKVFHGLIASTTEILNLYVGAMARIRKYVLVAPEGAADYWNI
jgi:hypothetical protein